MVICRNDTQNDERESSKHKPAHGISESLSRLWESGRAPSKHVKTQTPPMILELINWSAMIPTYLHLNQVVYSSWTRGRLVGDIEIKLALSWSHHTHIYSLVLAQSDWSFEHRRHQLDFRMVLQMKLIGCGRRRITKPMNQATNQSTNHSINQQNNPPTKAKQCTTAPNTPVFRIRKLHETSPFLQGAWRTKPSKALFQRRQISSSRSVRYLRAALTIPRNRRANDMSKGARKHVIIHAYLTFLHIHIHKKKT